MSSPRRALDSCPPRSRARMKWSSASERAPLSPRRSLSLKFLGSYRPSSSQIRVPVIPHSSSSWCQSAELRASREHSMSSTVIWLASQPSAIALPRRSYWRIADSVLWMTCLRLDWRTYKSAVLDRWAAVTFDAAVSGSIGVSFSKVSRLGGGAGGGRGERDGGQGVDELGGHRGREASGRGRVRAGRPAGWCRRARSDGGQAGQGVPPGGDALAGQHAEAERERLAARVQRGMTQLLVAGIQPAAGSTVLAGIQAGAWFSSRTAR